MNDYACFTTFMEFTMMMMMATGEVKMLIYDFETLASVIGSGSGSSPGGAGSPLLLLSLRKMYFKKKTATPLSLYREYYLSFLRSKTLHRWPK